MSAQTTTHGNVTYLDHEPHEIPTAPQSRARTRRNNIPPVARYNRFEGEAPPLSLDRTADHVDDYYSHFYCPICTLWRANGDSKASRACGHVFCDGCWNEWARTHGRGPPNNRLTTCPICRVETNQSDTREVDFRASRFNCDTEVSKRLANRIAQIRQENESLRNMCKELREHNAVLETQRNALVQFQAEMAKIVEDFDSMVLDEQLD